MLILGQYAYLASSGADHAHRMDSCSIVYDIFRADRVRGVSVSPFKSSASESALRDGCRLHGITASPDWDSRGYLKALLARALLRSKLSRMGLYVNVLRVRSSEKGFPCRCKLSAPPCLESCVMNASGLPALGVSFS